MKRGSGVLCPVFSLPGAYSIGSFGAPAFRFIDRLAEGGFSWWQVLPLGVCDEWNSPYKSPSAFSLNPWFIDLPTLFSDGLITEEELIAAQEKYPYLCEYDRLRAERMPLLFRAAARLGDPAPVHAFLAAHPQTAEFCRFMALKEQNAGKDWQEFCNPDPDEEIVFGWAFTQYEAYRQWQAVRAYARERGIGIIGDIPIYVAEQSSDVCFHREEFLLGADGRARFIAGVPPDYFSAEGQVWGNPLYNWPHARRNGYAFFRARLSWALELFDGMRLDHFRGFESYFRIAASAATAREGKWVRGPGNSFLRAISDLTSRALVIAEDLGEITPAVEELVRKSGFPAMRVLQFGFLGDAHSPHLPHNYPENCVAYTGTHDNNTLLGYLFEMPAGERRWLMRYCGASEENWVESSPAVLRTLLASHAGLAILPIQDIFGFGADTRINTPGVAEGNWAYRMTDGQLDMADFGRFLTLNHLYGRA